MRFNMESALCTICLTALTIGSAQAATVTFADLNTAATGNTANVGGDQTNLMVSRTGTGAAGTGYLYTFTYSNESYDGDATLDTLSFGVRVTGFSGGSATTALAGTTANGSSGNATLGGTASSIALTTKDSLETWTVGDSGMQVGETFSFSLESFSVTTSQGSYAAALDNFTILQTREGGGNTHPYVVGINGGSGDNLQARHWSNNAAGQDFMTFNTAQSPILYVTASTGAGNDEPNWGIVDVAFGVNVTAIPEPSSTALFGLAGLGLLTRRARK